jgi:hypothetical protein
MTKKLGLLLLGAVLLVAAICLHRRPEPEHPGRPLSYWLQLYELNTPIDSGLPEFKAARDAAASAIRTIGTNAVPFLVTMVYRNPHTWPPFPKWVPDWSKRFIGESGILSHDPCEEAGIGFMILGTNAQRAMPDMVRLMADKTRPLRARQATLNLSYLGPGALPFITAEMSNNPTEHFYYEWLITNNVLPTTTNTPAQ